MPQQQNVFLMVLPLVISQAKKGRAAGHRNNDLHVSSASAASGLWVSTFAAALSP
jgi:hypothetical protein